MRLLFEYTTANNAIISQEIPLKSPASLNIIGLIKIPIAIMNFKSEINTSKSLSSS